MIIPNKLKFGGHSIPIEGHGKKQNEKQGYYDMTHDFISIVNDMDLSESIIAEIFMHEIIEMINHRYGLELQHKTIIILSETLFSVMRDNNLDFGQGE